jgi:hypothetical protein
MRAQIAIATIALLAGCQAAIEREARSPAYKQGWTDGCNSGLYERSVEYSGGPQAVDRFERDEERFRTDPEYAAGWNGGVESCAVGRPGSPRR